MLLIYGKKIMKKVLTFPILVVITFIFIQVFAQIFAQTQVRVVTTIGMITDVVENVAENCVSVSTMMGPGVDPHLYQASARDVRTLQKADIIFYSGHHLEGQLGEVLERFGRNKPVVAVAETAIEEKALLKVINSNSVDPHLWMDVSLWAKTAEVIAEALAKLVSKCTEQMQQNAIDYNNRLLALHKWVTESIASIPEEQRILVTAHDAFAYYAKAYDIEVAAIQGISTESEASLADIRGIVNIVADRNIPALFVESSINPATIEAVLAAVKNKNVETSIGGELFSDAMGEKGTFKSTYIGMIYSNTKTITEALGGQIAILPEELCSWKEFWEIQ